MLYQIYFDSEILIEGGFPDFFKLTVIDSYVSRNADKLEWDELKEKIDWTDTFFNLKFSHGCGQSNEIDMLMQMDKSDGIAKLRELLDSMFHNKTLYVSFKIYNRDKNSMSFLVSKKYRKVDSDLKVTDDILNFGHLPYHLDVRTELHLEEGHYLTYFTGYDRVGNQVSSWVTDCKMNCQEEKVHTVIRTHPDAKVWLESQMTENYIELRIMFVLAHREYNHMTNYHNRIYVGNTDDRTVENPKWYEKIKDDEFLNNLSFYRRMFML